MKSSPFSLREFLSVFSNEKLLKNTYALHRTKNVKKVETKSFKCLAQLILSCLDDTQDIGGIFLIQILMLSPTLMYYFFQMLVLLI